MYKRQERDILICDENGFAQTKDLVYGMYTVEQTASGLEGLELMKPFDVFINQDGQTYRYLKMCIRDRKESPAH